MDEASKALSSSGLRIGFTKDKRHLVALLPREFSDLSISREWIIQQITNKGLSDLALLDDHINRLVSLYNSKRYTEKMIPIAERRDAEIYVAIDDDDMSAAVTVVPARGGKPVDEDMIYDALKTKKIKHGFMDDVITLIAAEGQAKNTCVVKGTRCKDGKDTQFQALIPEAKERSPQIREDGSVDYRDLGAIFTVTQGAELMRRIPATAGKPGMDIFARPLPATPGEDYAFDDKLSGATISPKDANLLIAASNGQPILADRGISVEPTLQFNKVDLSTGNVTFNGSVIVEGDVMTGMKITATGDIHIGGIVEAASLKADGDIKIEGSIIGHGEAYDQRGQLKADVTTIEAGGSISAKIVENVSLIAGDSIYIQEQLVRSSAKAVNEIIVGGRLSKTGQIIGGDTFSGILIRANTFGSAAGIRTTLEINIDAKLHKELEKVNAELQEASLNKDRLTNLVVTTRKQKGPPEALAKAVSNRRKAEAELNRLTQQAEKLKKEVRRIKNGKIISDKKIYAGTLIKISHSQKAINEELTGRPFQLLDDRIV